MAKYLAIARGYIDKKGILEPGVEFEYSRRPSEKWMAPVDDAAREAFKKAGFKVPASPPPANPEGEKGSFGPKGKGPKGKGGEKVAPDTPSTPGPKSTGDQEVI